MMILTASTDFQVYDQGTNRLSPKFREGKSIPFDESTRPWLCSILRFCKDLVRIK